MAHLTDDYSLWGNQNHLATLATALREKHGEDVLHVLVATSNSDFHTYDGIDIGGERVCLEVEDEIAKLAKDGRKVSKFSMLGYSLGGLVARYCIGLLSGRLENVEFVNFISFASPHLGVRAPVRHYSSNVWNSLGSRLLSVSGQQLFLIDAFRETGRPLLSVLADPNSIFMRALARFKVRTLYANVVNDRSAPWYTTGITRTDPFEDLAKVNLTYLANYEPTVLDLSKPVMQIKPVEQSFYARLASSTSAFLTAAPFYLALGLLWPIGATLFICNSGYQTIRSSRRVAWHQRDKLGRGYSNYRVPLMVEDAREAITGVFEIVNAYSQQQHLESPGSESSDSDIGSPALDQNEKPKLKLPVATERRDVESQTTEFATLALSPEQFEMIDALNAVGWNKFPVHIQLCRHSHAAIIVRTNANRYQEGHVVIRHWLDEQFEI